jgi:hypothetical protein
MNRTQPALPGSDHGFRSCPDCSSGRGNIRGNVQIVQNGHSVQIRGHIGRFGRIGSIRHPGYKVEGLVCPTGTGSA